MFDVDWSDPNRESVGDRRARKEKEKGHSDRAPNKDNADKDSKKDEQYSQASGPGSVRSSMSSVDKQFGFFGGKNRKKGRVLGNNKSIASSSTGAPTIHEQEPPEDSNPNDPLAEASCGVTQDCEPVNTEGRISPVASDRLDGSELPPLSPNDIIRRPQPTWLALFCHVTVPSTSLCAGIVS
jgi:hypothetical protein